jgi:predicted enzyme related to lactoylglutathione lyase
MMMARGEITHLEIPADDVERAKRFYGAVAGWEFGEPEGFTGYHMFRTGEASGGAIAKRGEMAPRQLRVYITVDSLESACSAAEANGGAVVERPTDIGGDMGRFAVVRDTEGTEVGLWETAATG